MGLKVKRILGLILTTVVVGCIGNFNVSAESLKQPVKFEGMHVLSDAYAEQTDIQLFTETNDYLPKLKEGNYDRWIDRVELSEEMYHFYEVLEEASDNDGKDDFLIDPENSDLVLEIVEKDLGEGEQLKGHGVKVAELRGTGKNWDEASAAVQNEFWKNYYGIRTAFEAFDRDHGNVFWLNSSCYISTSGYYGNVEIDEKTGEEIYVCTGDVYFMLESELQNWNIWHAKYTDENVLRGMIQTVENRVKEITAEVKDKEPVVQMKYFNEWLTKNNEYNHLVGLGGMNPSEVLVMEPDTFECTSALVGLTGDKGPVCEAYARAFKVLCDYVGIPCVLVDGLAFNGVGNESHMWNYAKVNGKWYAVDVTWNDPLGGDIGAVSGFECETYFLIGSDTMTYVGEIPMKFIESHPVENQLFDDSIAYPNGPVLNKTDYKPEVTPEETPEATPEETPEVTPEATPEVTPEETPEATPEVTPEATPETKPDVSEVFPDVKHNAWYETGVQYVYDKGLMEGSDGLFKPTDNVKRAQVIATLYRLAGSPEVEDILALIMLEDVPAGKYYTDAVCWAYSEGIVTGTGEGNRYFLGNDNIKRQQLAAMLRRYATVMGYSTSETTDISNMLNANAVSGYAVEDVKWAVAVGLISGSEVKDANGNTAYDLKPHDTATRGQLAAILMRFCENNK